MLARAHVGALLQRHRCSQGSNQAWDGGPGQSVCRTRPALRLRRRRLRRLGHAALRAPRGRLLEVQRGDDRQRHALPRQLRLLACRAHHEARSRVLRVAKIYYEPRSVMATKSKLASQGRHHWMCA